LIICKFGKFKQIKYLIIYKI